MPINITTQATLRAIGKVRKGIGTNIAKGLDGCAKIAAAESQILVPKDTHALEQSMQIVSTGVGMGAKSQIIYTSPYAWVVHEDPTKKHDPPTQYKYLTTAVNRRRGTMTAKLKRQMGVKIEGV